MAFVLLGLAVIVGTFAWGGVRGAPWVPTKAQDIARILRIAPSVQGKVVADLGCGTGSLLREFAQRGARVRGWELAVPPWLIARWRLRGAPDARIAYGDFWRASLADVDLVYAFLMPSALARLAEKLRRELRPGTHVLTYVWPLPGWDPVRVDRRTGMPTIYLYTA